MLDSFPKFDGPGDLRRAILSVLVSRDGPVGQGSIGLELQQHDVNVSTPTIGRCLQEMEFEGLLEKIGVQGRIPTERGRQVFEQLQAEAMLRESGTELLTTLTRGDEEHLLELLFARLCLEGATAALAAEHATPQMIARLEDLLREQTESVKDGELGVQEDVVYHNEIAKASGNRVLASLVALLRKHHRYNLAITSIRTQVGSRLVVDHAAVLDAIKRRDPAAAREAMERHLQGLAEDLERYWLGESADHRESEHVAQRGSRQRIDLP